jgi:hypothetical protein
MIVHYIPIDINLFIGFILGIVGGFLVNVWANNILHKKTLKKEAADRNRGAITELRPFINKSKKALTYVRQTYGIETKTIETLFARRSDKLRELASALSELIEEGNNRVDNLSKGNRNVIYLLPLLNNLHVFFKPGATLKKDSEEKLADHLNSIEKQLRNLLPET